MIELPAVVAAARTVAGLCNTTGPTVHVLTTTRVAFSIPIEGGALGSYRTRRMIRRHVPILPTP